MTLEEHKFGPKYLARVALLVLGAVAGVSADAGHHRNARHAQVYGNVRQSIPTFHNRVKRQEVVDGTTRIYVTQTVTTKCAAGTVPPRATSTSTAFAVGRTAIALPTEKDEDVVTVTVTNTNTVCSTGVATTTRVAVTDPTSTTPADEGEVVVTVTSTRTSTVCASTGAPTITSPASNDGEDTVTVTERATSTTSLPQTEPAEGEEVVVTTTVTSTSTVCAATTTRATIATTTTTTTTAAATTTTAGAGKRSCKRGVGYEEAALTHPLDICWGYNWGMAERSGVELKEGVEFVPMKWGNGDRATWARSIENAILNGAEYLLGFNEPDLGEQSNLSPALAAQLWKEFLEPYADRVKLVSPAVTNGGGSMGIQWLADFIQACNGGCTFHALAMHWYSEDTTPGNFMAHFKKAYDRFDGKYKIWVTEFMLTTPAAQPAWLRQVIPLLEQADYIERYAGFGAFSGSDMFGMIAPDRTSLTAMGKAYSES